MTVMDVMFFVGIQDDLGQVDKLLTSFSRRAFRGHVGLLYKELLTGCFDINDIIISLFFFAFIFYGSDILSTTWTN